MRIDRLLLALGAAALLASCSKTGDGHDDEQAAERALPADFALTSASITLPEDFNEPFPAGPHVEAMDNNCRACHSLSMILAQPPLSRADWAKTVDKMRDVFKAPVPDGEVPKILDYLEALSKKQPA